jgi:hypothetical protein
MNNTLRSLASKLSWQINALEQRISIIHQQLTELEIQRQVQQQTISEASAISAIIHPEQEMARLHFLLCEQTKHDHLNASYTALQTEKNELLSKKLRFQTELKQLEKYVDRQDIQRQQQVLLNEQKNTDEWVLLHHGAQS